MILGLLSTACWTSSHLTGELVDQLEVVGELGDLGGAVGAEHGLSPDSGATASERRCQRTWRHGDVISRRMLNPFFLEPKRTASPHRRHRVERLDPGHIFLGGHAGKGERDRAQTKIDQPAAFGRDDVIFALLDRASAMMSISTSLRPNRA